ncbi:MAG: hypothetical protein ABSH20_15550 [Tepidisphaeraceae bacterium]
MSVRKRLLLFAVLALLIGGAIAVLCAINQEPESGAVVFTIGGFVFAILVAIALFVGGRPKSPAETGAQALLEGAQNSAAGIIARANQEAARLLADAAEKAMALSSLDRGKCQSCGNPRTGKFCPKCGRPA